MNHQESYEDNKKFTAMEPSNQNNFWLILITILLMFSLSLNIYQLFFQQTEPEVSTARLEAIESAEKLLRLHRPIVNVLESDYQKNVYNNPRVDNINKQLLMSQEYTFLTLQLIAEQNLQTIELLSTFE